MVGIWWISLDREIGYKKARIVAQAVSWAFRYSNWRFYPWYEWLKEDDKKYVDKYFDKYLHYELKEMSENKRTDISSLINHYKLPDNIHVKNRNAVAAWEH